MVLVVTARRAWCRVRRRSRRRCRDHLGSHLGRLGRALRWCEHENKRGRRGGRGGKRGQKGDLLTYLLTTEREAKKICCVHPFSPPPGKVRARARDAWDWDTTRSAWGRARLQARCKISAPRQALMRRHPEATRTRSARLRGNRWLPRASRSSRPLTRSRHGGGLTASDSSRLRQVRSRRRLNRTPSSLTLDQLPKTRARPTAPHGREV